MNKHLVGITSGFIIVIVIMVAVIFYGLNRMNNINVELNTSLLEQNKKAKLVFEMREGMLNQVVSLFSLLFGMLLSVKSRKRGLPIRQHMMS